MVSVAEIALSACIQRSCMVSAAGIAVPTCIHRTCTVYVASIAVLYLLVSSVQ